MSTLFNGVFVVNITKDIPYPYTYNSYWMFLSIKRRGHV